MKESFSYNESAPQTPTLKERLRKAAVKYEKFTEAWFAKKVAYLLDMVVTTNIDKIDGALQRQIFTGIIEAFSNLSHYRIDKLFPITWLKILKVF
jgi:hypothetical protein